MSTIAINDRLFESLQPDTPRFIFEHVDSEWFWHLTQPVSHLERGDGLIMINHDPWRSDARAVEVNWLPPDRDLHYNMLYCGIWEYLREPPNAAYFKKAKDYLATLMQCPNAGRLQRDRIRWTRAWIDALLGRSG